MKIQSQDLEHQPADIRGKPERRKIRGPWGLREQRRRSPMTPDGPASISNPGSQTRDSGRN